MYAHRDIRAYVCCVVKYLIGRRLIHVCAVTVSCTYVGVFLLISFCVVVADITLCTNAQVQVAYHS